MSQVKEIAVKLFGWTMTSLDHDSLSSSSSSPVRTDSFDSSSSFSSSSPSLGLHMMMNNQACDNSELQDDPSLKIAMDLNNDSDNSDDQHSEITTATTSEEKSTDLKKPDKVLPCPRCKSVDTKFCYYNNYNVNQPRHFCRNCQRYWTAGGTMRTVPVGSGRRKNKGWVSSDHYLNTTSEDTNDDYNNSSTKFLSFESSGSLSDKHQSNDAKAESISQEGFLPPQVSSPVSPHQYPPNPSFYHMPVFWGYAAPVWSTIETSTCLGKRTRDETSYDAVQSTISQASITTNSHVWYPVPMKHQKTEQFRFSHHGSETKRYVPETYLTLQANPAAMARSINFRECM